jgi:cytochrome c biogenesis protein CcmG, thiol:disulfide interchange protein DsbE
LNRVFAFAPLIALVVLVAVSAFLLLRPGERETVTEGHLGRPLPAYTLDRLGGGAPVASTDFAGQPHLINLFASWCVGCRAEHELLAELQRNGVVIVGIAYKDRPENTQAFLDELGNPFTAIGMDPRGRYGLDLGVAGAPETFVIGADGRIVAVHRGPLTPEILEREILPALSRP